MSKTKNNYFHVGILSAMPEEIGCILSYMKCVQSSKYGDLELFSGEWEINKNKSIYLTVGWSGWGKVSAARATTRLLSKTFKGMPIDMLLFTGVAGAVDKKLNQWDVVLSDSVIQHDMDARPIFEKYVVPAINHPKIFPNRLILDKVFKSLRDKLKQKKFGNLHKGLIATGDMFISERKKLKQLSEEISGVLAIEMEGAAFAQVAHQEKVDWIILRVISDGADESAHDQFNEFLEKYKFKSIDLIECFLKSLFEE